MAFQKAIAQLTLARQSCELGGIQVTTFDIVAPANDPKGTSRWLGLRTLVFFVAVVGLVVAANAFAVIYVTSEHYIYYWDWSRYWLMFQDLGYFARNGPLRAIRLVAGSIRNDDYNVLPVVPLVPFELIFGPGRLSYILAITNVVLLPAATLLAWVGERTAQPRSWGRLIVSTALLL